MSEKDIKVGSQGLSGDRMPKRISVTVSRILWEEKIVAAFAEDERLQAVLEREDNFYERFAEIGFLKDSKMSCHEKRFMGKLLAHAVCFGYGKRWLAGKSGLSYTEAQRILNWYYQVFGATRRWVKSFGWEETQGFLKRKIEGMLDKATTKCCGNLPSGWEYESETRFLIPEESDRVGAEKFFRHFYEHEIWIESKMIKLGVDVIFVEVV